MNNSLQIDTIIKLRKLFEKQRWNVNDKKQIFDNYCKMLSLLSEEQQQLILQLTEDFLYCPYTKYNSMIKKAIAKIDINTVTNCKEIYLLPLVKPSDVGKIKSSTSWLYSCLTECLPYSPLSTKKKKAYTDPNLLQNHPNRQNALILFCDDYIGTGDTGSGCITYYNDNLKVETDIPIVLALVAQEIGVNAINALGVNIIASIVKKRGISDSNKFQNKFEALKIMESIESKLKISSSYKNGYKGSEALVSMMRTPNNTFPVFWCKNCKDEQSWPAPFERI